MITFVESFRPRKADAGHSEAFAGGCYTSLTISNLDLCKQGEDFSSCDFIGPDLLADIAQAVARGDMNPCTHEWFEEAAAPCSKQDAPIVEDAAWGGTRDEIRAKPQGKEGFQHVDDMVSSDEANKDEAFSTLQADSSSSVVFKAKASPGSSGSAFSNAKVGKFQSSLLNYVSVSEQAKKSFVPPRRHGDADCSPDGAARTDLQLKRKFESDESMQEGDNTRGRFKTRNIFCADLSSKPITSKFFKVSESINENNKDLEEDGEGDPEFSLQANPAAMSEDVTAKSEA